MGKKPNKDKFERFEERQQKDLAAMLPGTYERKGESYKISDEVKKVASQAMAADQAWRERIDYTSVFMSGIDPKAQGVEGLAKAYRTWSAELGGPDFKGLSDQTLVDYVVKKTMRMYRAEDAVEDFLNGGDVLSLDKIKRVMLMDAKNMGAEKAKEKVNALRNENGEIPGDKLIELNAATASYQALQSLGAVRERPYAEGMTDPGLRMSGLNQGMYAPQTEGVVSGARNLDRIVNYN